MTPEACSDSDECPIIAALKRIQEEAKEGRSTSVGMAAALETMHRRRRREELEESASPFKFQVGECVFWYTFLDHPMGPYVVKERGHLFFEGKTVRTVYRVGFADSKGAVTPGIGVSSSIVYEDNLRGEADDPGSESDAPAAVDSDAVHWNSSGSAYRAHCKGKWCLDCYLPTGMPVGRAKPWHWKVREFDGTVYRLIASGYARTPQDGMACAENALPNFNVDSEGEKEAVEPTTAPPIRWKDICRVVGLHRAFWHAQGKEWRLDCWRLQQPLSSSPDDWRWEVRKRDSGAYRYVTSGSAPTLGEAQGCAEELVQNILGGKAYEGR